MSSAHRPTWDPAQGRATNLNTRQYSARDMASHTKLKFRQVGQSSTGEVKKRDLLKELREAEEEVARKRGRPIETIESGSENRMIEDVKEGDTEEEERRKRRKVLEEALEADKDDSDEEDDVPHASKSSKGKERAFSPSANGGAPSENGNDKDAASDSDDDDSDDSDDEEDETAELLRELEKIKRERAEEKERQEREKNENETKTREEEIALGNPLLNLQAALGRESSATPSLSVSGGSFQVKRRWDDDVIFKNQAKNLNGNKGQPKEFVNDLLRTEFHKKFLKRYIV